VGTRATARVGSKARQWEGLLVKESDKLDDAGCRRLWAAVMYEAVRGVDRGEAPAINWVYSRRTGVGSMRWICDMLDLDYNKLSILCTTRDGRSVILRRAESGKRSPRSML
jgi:hypothetical protein